jgi:subtilisin family serine protease
VSGGGGFVSGGGGFVSGGGESTGQLPATQSRPQNISQARALERSTSGLDTLINAGLSGEGKTVLVIDSGFDPQVMSSAKLVAFRDFVGDCPDKHACDLNSHGTFVSSVIHELAPGAGIAAARVLNRSGRGDIQDVIKALKWGLSNAKKWKLRVINLSLGSDKVYTGSWNDFDELNSWVKKAREKNIFVVSSVGNSSQLEIESAPANSADAITVGSFFHGFTPSPSDDVISSFSNFGFVQSSQAKHHRIGLGGLTLFESTDRNIDSWTVKPDVLAPGEYVAAQGVPGTLSFELAHLLSDLESLGPDSSELPSQVHKILSQLTALQQLEVAILARSAENPLWAERQILLRLPLRHIEGSWIYLSGSSFAAPAVSAGLLLLEEGSGQQGLDPVRTKELLMSCVQEPSRWIDSSSSQSDFRLIHFKGRQVGAVNWAQALAKLRTDRH